MIADLRNCIKYWDDVAHVASLPLPWEKLEDRKILISGATGLLGSFLIDVLLWRNQHFGSKTVVYGMCRNLKRAKERFDYSDDSRLVLLSHDINLPFEMPNHENLDYIFHLASNTHPVSYATDPIGTITTNIYGTKNLLDLASKCHVTRFALASSNEIYGENRGDVELFDEFYCGYIDSNTMRAGYPEAKRCSESLCQAYSHAMGVDVVLPRFTRSYGPTVLDTDTKAISQFIMKGINRENIVLKSAGTQYYSYTYVSDAISGFLTVVLKGQKGQAYNIADQSSDIMLKDLAHLIASKVGTRVVFECPDHIEAAGYSKASKARLSGNRLSELGWKPQYDIKTGIERTLDILMSS